MCLHEIVYPTSHQFNSYADLKRILIRVVICIYPEVKEDASMILCVMYLYRYNKSTSWYVLSYTTHNNNCNLINKNDIF